MFVFVCCSVTNAFCSLCNFIWKFLLFKVCICFHFFHLLFSSIAMSRGFLDFDFGCLQMVTQNKHDIFTSIKAIGLRTKS